MKRVADEHALQVKYGTILVQEAGQLGGLIGRSVFVGAHLDGFAVSNNMVRVTSKDPQDAGYLYGLFSTPQGVILLSREAAGSSIPHMEAGRLNAISIPWPPEELRHKISRIVENATDLQDQASKAEEEARSLVERAIEETP
jgi:type I restriction enzyme S subunit